MILLLLSLLLGLLNAQIPTNLTLNEIWFDDHSQWLPINEVDGIHGFWGNDLINLTRKFMINDNSNGRYATIYSQVNLTFDLYIMCTWDNEYFRVYNNDQLIWKKSFQFSGNNIAVPMEWRNAGICATQYNYKYRIYRANVVFYPYIHQMFTSFEILTLNPLWVYVCMCVCVCVCVCEFGCVCFLFAQFRNIFFFCGDKNVERKQNKKPNTH